MKTSEDIFYRMVEALRENAQSREDGLKHSDSRYIYRSDFYEEAVARAMCSRVNLNDVII